MQHLYLEPVLFLLLNLAAWIRRVLRGPIAADPIPAPQLFGSTASA